MSNNNNVKTKESTDVRQHPVTTIRRGAVAASIWKRQTPTGFEYLDFSLSRSWKLKSSEKEGYSQNFFVANEEALGEVVNRHHRLDVPHAAPAVFNEHPLVEILMTPGLPSDTSWQLRRRRFTHLIVDSGWIRRSAVKYPSLAPLAGRRDLLDPYVRSLGPPLATEGGEALRGPA